MKVAIVGGTAGIGFALGVRLARQKVEVLIGSRDANRGVTGADRVAAAAANGGGEIATPAGGANDDVVSDADFVVVAVPFPGQAEIYSTIKPALPKGVTILDCTVPLASEFGGKPTRVLGIWEGSAAQQAKGILGSEVHLASGFHTISAAALESKDEEVGDVLVCGDKEGRAAAREFVDLLPTARFVDCGPLENARILESLTALLIGINHRYKPEMGAGLSITRI